MVGRCKRMARRGRYRRERAKSIPMRRRGAGQDERVTSGRGIRGAARGRTCTTGTNHCIKGKGGE